ncbi:uncharacterized protein LOC110067193 [Orbicella faveolata]|uniref:uncharacterized protein LOC110067193 n=1 Tax=Orbicella faveolata TaxID=48498 RepID=UPI0009E61BA1|nr:uncharacterized protein LOC110067193 [Orbicella faveolata]
MKGFTITLLIVATFSLSACLPARNPAEKLLTRVKREDEAAKNDSKAEEERPAPGLGGTNVRFPICIYQLGMSNRFSIWDNQITASSAHSSLHLKPHMGRLNNPYGSWCIKRRHRGPHYLQSDLGM